MRKKGRLLTGLFVFAFALSFGISAASLDSNSAGACCAPCNCYCETGGLGYSHLGGPCQWTTCHTDYPLCNNCGDHCGPPD